jgi:hypothetical protein
MDDNGSGNAGGNGSVYWLVRSGGYSRLSRSKREAQAPLAPPGHVLINDDLVQGHTSESFRSIGRSAVPKRKGEHPGLFLVRLRFRTADLGKLTPEQREWVKRNRDPKLSNEQNSYVVIYVPAIDREVIDGRFDDTDWEIHWEW